MSAAVWGPYSAAFPAPCRCRREGELFGRIVRLVRHPCSRQGRPGVQLYPLIVEEDLHRFVRPLHPDLLPDVSRRQGIVGFIENDMMVRMDGASLPGWVFEGCFGQRLQLVLLFGKEDRVGFSLRRAVDLLPDLFLHQESARSLASRILVKVLPARSCCLTTATILSTFPFWARHLLFSPDRR